jgi:predicted glycoside hydrolase/deacetylase ChbG (UPF0249 family)
MKVCILISLSFLISCGVSAQNKTIAERLGYNSNAKLLIIHADDLGVSHSENIASIKALEETPVNSASIMVPCPWFPEIAKYARENQTADLGLHLTLNSEWLYYKWSPVTSLDAVTTLVNDKGYFYSQIQDVVQKANAKEVALELRNQIKKAYQFGIDVTHLDAHMRTAISSPEFLEAYINLGKEFKLPVLLNKNMPLLQHERIQALIDDKVVINDMIYTAIPTDFDSGMANYYTKVLQNLEPGLNSLLIHLAYDNDEMKAITVEHDYWHSKWRQADMDFFSSAECATLLKQNNITLVTWRELRDKIIRAN